MADIPLPAPTNRTRTLLHRLAVSVPGLGRMPALCRGMPVSQISGFFSDFERLGDAVALGNSQTSDATRLVGA
jgi:hypothetical protein